MQEVMQSVMQNPHFTQMAEQMGQKMMQDPGMGAMMRQMSDPAARQTMEAKLKGARLGLRELFCLAGGSGGERIGSRIGPAEGFQRLGARRQRCSRSPAADRPGLVA